MPPEIFSLLQLQTGIQITTQGQSITPQEDLPPGMFDALMAEYTSPNFQDSDITPQASMTNPTKTFQPTHFVTGKGIPATVELLTGEITQDESAQNERDNSVSWRNLFADVRRNAEAPTKHHEIAAPLSDFDEGIVLSEPETESLPPENIMSSIPEIETAKPAMTETHDDVHPESALKETHDDVQPESAMTQASDDAPAMPEITQAADDIPTEHERVKAASESGIPERHDSPQPKPVNAESEAPHEVQAREIPQEDFTPKTNDTHESHPAITHYTAPKSETLTNESEPDRKPEIIMPETDTTPHEAPYDVEEHDTEIHQPYDMPESHDTQETHDIPESHAPIEPDGEPETPAPKEPHDKIEPRAQNHDVPRKPSVTRESPIRERENDNDTFIPHEPHEAPKNETKNLNDESDVREIFDEFSGIVVDERSESETGTVYQGIESKPESEYRDTKTENTRKFPEPHETLTNMAGLAGVQPEIFTSTTPENTPVAQNITEPPKNSRPSRAPQQPTRNTTRNVSPETVSEETHSLTQDSQSQTQNQTHDSEPETQQPSQTARNESQNDGSISRERVPAANTNASRTAAKPESRNDIRTDTRRTNALNDFQSFFDGATRAKRSSSHASTTPLSLRSATYEASGIQSQGRTLRSGIVNVVRFIRSDGVRKANIVVDPPALGRITVELTSSSSGVEASVKVASEQIRQIVQDQISQLRDNLLQQGVQVSEFTVDVQQDNTGQGHDSGGQNQRDNYAYTASDDDDDTETFRVDLEEGLLYWIA